MKRFFSKTAVTLIELIVAVSLVSIVLLGLSSINMVLSNNNQDYGQRYLVRSETQATLNHILNNASLAVGSGSANDEGVLIGAAVGDPNSFCIHQGPNNNIFNNVNNDIWLCYTLSSNQIKYCTETYSAGGDPRGAASCTASPNITSGPTFLGTAYSITNPSSSLNSTTGFSITIQNCLNDSALGCNSSGISTLPANNPEVQITGTVFPPQESF
jgi:hypothetical protein